MGLCRFCSQLEARRADPRVAVFGAGIAGLTAAHELSERGFSVDVFESGEAVGGLAATQRFPSTRIFENEEVAKKNWLPGEHGFRAFYSFYRHLTDTMQRIPLWDRADGEAIDGRDAAAIREPVIKRPLAKRAAGKQMHAPGDDGMFDLRRGRVVPRSVADNLIPTYKVAVALEGDMFREIQYDRRQPRSTAAAAYALGVWMVAMGFPSSDIVRLQTRLLQFLTSCRERRYHELANVSLLDYLGQKNLSERFRTRFANISRFLVAIDPSEGDAMTQAMIMCRLLMDPVVSGEAEKNVDRVLNGPTSERWLDPWEFFLRKQGVQFVFHQVLERFVMSGKLIAGAELACRSKLACDRRGGYRLETGARMGYRYFVSAVSGDQLARVLSRSGTVLAADARETKAQAREDERLRQEAAHFQTRKAHMKRPRTWQERDAFVTARRAAWINTARAGATVVSGDPDLQSWVDLVAESRPITARKGGANYRPWMSGIQFYLSDNLSVLPGHIHFPDSKWALTAVCQSQFWGGDFFWRYGRGKVRSILSVDICEFTKPGELFNRPALECNPGEIAREVWHQMKEGLKAWDMVLPDIFKRAEVGRPKRPFQKVLATAAKQKKIAAEPVPLPYLDHHLDDRIVFSNGKIDMRRSNIRYFVPGRGSWTSRPGPLPPLESWDRGYRVRLGSLVIVGSFAQTFTSINTMEAANESGRHGVNALLEHYERVRNNESPYVHYERCTIWPLEADEPADLDFWKQVDRKLFWDDEARKPKDDHPHIFEILGLDKMLAVMLPNHKDIDNAAFDEDTLWDSDGWKRFEKRFGGLFDKLLTLGRFSSP